MQQTFEMQPIDRELQFRCYHRKACLEIPLYLATAAAETMAVEEATSGSMDSLSNVRTHRSVLPVDLAARAVASSRDLGTCVWYIHVGTKMLGVLAVLQDTP